MQFKLNSVNFHRHCCQKQIKRVDFQLQNNHFILKIDMRLEHKLQGLSICQMMIVHNFCPQTLFQKELTHTNDGKPSKTSLAQNSEKCLALSRNKNSSIIL
ncbi:hypothetical protein BpHYR1_024013 [Brachionus plicatilis]|uniref:Uncharacterized protein n=1 Tax=Brachionus plicatilis TaxID=10195 RepID=A0A3M7SIZ0_BRAPC|nr:hypothetical protein BpHYR1_024013 [Brachionus plicatilis]